ncbi:MAG: flagellar hook-associated protein FlgK [Desulfobacterales bacterium]|jgi:flagellar hook-associated protein 1 FlgK|nr:flagellar hook-associated protein FlgK [Desulfobacterales bacterium]
MSDINGIMSMAAQALTTQQQAISVTSHNIANVNTPGYSRQKLVMTTNSAVNSVLGPMGNGVSADAIERIYDRFISAQINNESQALGRWDAQKNAVESLEMIFNETYGYGLNEAMSEYWNAWQALSNNPAGLTERQMLLTRGQILTSAFNKLDSDLTQSQRDQDFAIGATVTDVNWLAEQIVDLNQKIVSTETGTQNANDYRDKRELVLKELSELIDINAFEDTNGNVSVLIADGRPLVTGGSLWQLSTEPNASGLQDVVWIDNVGNPVNINNDISGGKLKGWIETRDVLIPDYRNRLDSLARTLTTEVNNLHQNGFALNQSAGLVFFDGTGRAADIEVNANIVANLDLIAAAADALTVPGDNRNAIEITNLQHQLLMSGNTATFNEYYSSLVRDVGNEVLKSESYYTHQSDMVAQLDNYRESVSGVSLDEEMINLIKFQNAYAAAAKMISTADEMIQTVLQMV